VQDPRPADRAQRPQLPSGPRQPQRDPRRTGPRTRGLRRPPPALPPHGCLPPRARPPQHPSPPPSPAPPHPPPPTRTPPSYGQGNIGSTAAAHPHRCFQFTHLMETLQDAGPTPSHHIDGITPISTLT